MRKVKYQKCRKHGCFYLFSKFVSNYITIQFFRGYLNMGYNVVLFLFTSKEHWNDFLYGAASGRTFLNIIGLVNTIKLLTIS